LQAFDLDFAELFLMGFLFPRAATGMPGPASHRTKIEYPEWIIPTGSGVGGGSDDNG
jgi:hypothetical protein